MIKQPHEIDFSKIKRFFAFGCSFTDYIWPTWADMIAKEMPTAEFHNLGRCGGGNLMIASRISESNRRYKFTDTDLIIPMWTTFAREDRYLRSYGGWWATGNIFSQNELSDEYVKKFADLHGYLLRDISIMDLTLSFLNNINSSAVSLLSVPLDYQQEEGDPFVKDVLDLYENVKSYHLPSLIELELNGEWENGHEYSQKGQRELFLDYHPNPRRYFNYLKKLGFKLSSSTNEYAIKSCNQLKEAKTREEIIKLFGDEKNNHCKLF